MFFNFTEKPPLRNSGRNRETIRETVETLMAPFMGYMDMAQPLMGCPQGHSVPTVVSLPDICNLNLIVRKHQTSPNGGTFCKTMACAL